MARATLFDPVTRARTAVESGSQEARDLFSRGYKLETPTQNLQTWSATPQREIVQGQGTQLLARDNATGSSTPISNPAELSRLVVGGGYQDTRAPLFPTASPGGTSGPAAPQAPAVPGGGPAPAAPGNPRQTAQGNPVEAFNSAISDLLRGVRSSSDLDLMRQRNELINQRFNNVAAETPTNLSMLAPSQNRSLRALENQGVEERLGGITAAIQSRDKERQTALAAVELAQKSVKDFQDNARADREDARKFITDQFQLFGSAAFEGSSEDDVADMERKAQLPGGTLSNQTRTLKERELLTQKNDYPAGMVGEYMFYADQEKAAGRQPVGFNEYQNQDANRKARAEGGVLTPGQVQSTVNQIVNQFDNEPVVRTFNVVADGYGFANTLQNKQNITPSDDQGLIYAFAKAMDPGSVVREGEYATVQRYAQSWADSFGFKLDRLFSNTTFLTPEARQNMVSTIGSKYVVAKRSYDNVVANYNRRIEEAKSGVISGSLTDYSGGYGPPPDTYGGGYGDQQGAPQQPQPQQNVITGYNPNPFGGSRSPGSTAPMVGQPEQQRDALDDFLDRTGGGFKTGLGTPQNGQPDQARINRLAAAIAQHETGNRNVPGATGELATRYQFMPDTWKSLARQYLGNANAPTTDRNQDYVAKAYIRDLYAKGYDERQIAMVWNGGKPYRKVGTTTTKDGRTINYDTGKYADSVLGLFNSRKA